MLSGKFQSLNAKNISGEDYLSPSRLLRWYISFFQKDRLRIATGVLLTLLQSIALVPVPLIIRRIIDTYIPARNTHAILAACAIAAGLYLLHAMLAFSGRSLTLLCTKRVTENLRALLCMQLQQMSLRFYDLERASELHARVVIDTERIDVMGNAIVVHGVSSTIMFFIASGVLSWVNFQLFLMTIALLPLFYTAHRILKPRMREVNRLFRDGMEGMSSKVNDLLQSIRLVKSFAREAHEQKRAERQFRTVTRSALAMTILDSFYNNLMGFLTNSTTIAIYATGGLLITRGRMTIGDLIAFTGIIGFLISPINILMGMVTMVYAGLASLKPVHRLLTLDDPLEKYKGKRIVTRLNGAVAFEHVSFVYDTTGKKALCDINVSVHTGETIALVGESGAGKTTFSNLIMGFYFPTEGRVLIDGMDIHELNLRTLRECIGVVSQENVLLNTSIIDNLRYGRMDATKEEVIAAARAANALEFIEQTAEGFDAVVGDRGVRLSGGQRQRLAIARALLKNPRILILDEATSSLDSESEAKIQEAIERLKANRTCFIIAHRLSTVISADRILVFKEGSIVESGKHAELLAKGGEYARLCQRQFPSAQKESA
ncbi:MAG: ABC transporter ATP-binding protein [Candidatus Sumerlaeota bacterium]|nr:ABC transporter ATP-binding protein [Candidatus Sumerlaeota bacterium]